VKQEDVLYREVLPDATFQASAGQIERRRHVRFPVAVNAELIDRRSETRLTGLVTDLGAGGCYIDAPKTFSAGTQVEVFLRCEGRMFHCDAVVTYASTVTGVGMGVAFTQTAPDQKTSLLDWVRELGAVPPSKFQDKAKPEIRASAETELVTVLGWLKRTVARLEEEVAAQK
jgi:hypothetical protein